MPISHNRRSLDRVPRSPRSEVTPRRARADPPPIVVVANFPMSPTLSAIAAPGAPLGGHHHRAHRHRLITHSRAPAGAPPQTCLLPMSAPRNPLSARPRRCWPHRSARCPRLPSAAAPPGRSCLGLPNQLAHSLIRDAGHPGDLAQAFPTLPHRVQRTPALHALLASPLRGLLKPSACRRSASHSSTASARSRAEKNVARSSTLARVRRASSSWDAAAADRAARRASLVIA